MKASCSGAMGVEGMVDSFSPLPALPHLGPVTAKLLEEKDIDFICANRLKKSSLGRAPGLQEEPSMIQRHQAKNIGALGAKEVAEADKFVICKTRSGLLFCGVVGVVGVGLLTVFNCLLGSLPVPSSGRPAPFSRLRRRAQPVYLPREGPHWGQQLQMTQWGLPLPPVPTLLLASRSASKYLDSKGVRCGIICSSMDGCIRLCSAGQGCTSEIEHDISAAHVFF